MMRSCPTCGGQQLLEARILEEPGFRVDGCGRCGGIWISEPSYRDWLERNRNSLTAPASQDAVPTFEPNEGPMLRKCPTCASILGRYRVGHGIPFTIDRCYHCRGVWLDRHEWEALRSRNLHADIHAIFTDEWQSDIRRREAEEKEEAYRRRVLGDDGLQQLNGFITWANGHPMRHLILGMLLEGLDSDAARARQREVDERLRIMRAGATPADDS